MPLKVLVAENIPATREAICLRINKHPELEVVADFATVTDTVNYLTNKKNKPLDALFLDVRLDDDDAWEILHQLNDHQIEIPPVILITAEEEKGYAEIVFRNFKYEVVDYFIKPFGKKWTERRNECVANIRTRLAIIQAENPPARQPATFLEISEGTSSRIVAVKQLTHVLKIKNANEQFPLSGLYLYTTEQPDPLFAQQYKALNHLTKELASPDFISGHRDNLINRKHVSGFVSKDRQNFAAVGPFRIEVPLSEEGGRRLREGMGL